MNEHDGRDLSTRIRDGATLDQVRLWIARARDKNAFVTERSRLNYTALHRAVGRTDLSIARLLIDYATDKNAYILMRDWDDQTALHNAAALSNSDIVRLLIDNATDKNAYIAMRDNSSQTALHNAAKKSDLDIARLLIDNATDKNAYIAMRDRYDQTALHNAAALSNSDIVRLLIDNATDKNAYIVMRDNSGQTALHKAAEKSDLDIARLLINNATDKTKYVTMKDNYDRTALSLAAKHCSSFPLVKALIEPLILEHGDHTDLVPKYIDHADSDKITPLLRAAELSRVETVLYLMELGADPAKKDSNKNTVWDLALRRPGAEHWRIIAAVILRVRPEFRISMRSDGWERIWANNMGEVYIRLGQLAPLLYESASNDPEYHKIIINQLTCFLRQVRREFHENQEAPRHLRSREPLCIIRTLDCPKAGYTGSKDFISLVVPLISIGKLQTVEERQAECIENAGILYHLNSKDGKWLENHMGLTLDEYCRPALPEDVLKVRNGDQVISRNEKRRQGRDNATQRLPNDRNKEKAPDLLTELWILVRAYVTKLRNLIYLRTRKAATPQPLETVAETDLSPTNAVFIHQAWIWKVGDGVIVSPPPNSFEDFPCVTAIGHPAKHIGIALTFAELVSFFDITLSREPMSRSLLKIYENELSAISEDVDQYMKSVLVEDIDIDLEKEYFHQISDLREEVSMIKSVLAEQEEVWREFMSAMWPDQDPAQQQVHKPDTKDITQMGFEDEGEWDKVWRPRVLFNKYRRRIAKLEEDSERVERRISIQLDLKQKHAALKEAHSAAMVGAMVFGFTIITVIFAPLSFVAALFALPIDKFNEGKDGNQKDGVYSSSYIGKWSAATVLVSIAVTLLAMWAGLRFVGLHIWGKKGLRAYIREKANAIRAEENNMRERVTRDGKTIEGGTEEKSTGESNTEEDGDGVPDLELGQLAPQRDTKWWRRWNKERK